MTFSLTTVLVILVAHFIADYVCQTRWMGRNKSSNWAALGWHILVYTWVVWMLSVEGGILWAVANGWAHGATDAVTSRSIKKVYAKFHETKLDRWEYLTFILMGLDQLIHLACLFGSWHWLNG